jgi:CheY-like chemotaxis protein
VLLPDIVREVAEFALRGSNVRCSFDIAEDLWPANVDKGQIGQVVQNVAINAMQAMPGGGVLDVSMRNEIVADEPGPVLAPGRYLHLKFTDHGHGIRPEDLEKIFDPYFTTKKNGSGLGLATVHSIVKKHAGHITAESVPANGTTFHIWLPAAQDAPGARITLSEPETKPAPAAAKARILFMDDEVPIRTLGGAILRKMGYEVTSVADGAAAVREYAKAMGERRPFGAVILDLTIPGGMGGRQTLEELLKLDPGVVAVVCSGYSNDTVLSNYRAHGFRGMVSKPYEAADLALAIERALRGGRA